MKRSPLILLSSLCLSVFTACRTLPQPPKNETTLAIFSINDFHGGFLQDLRKETPGAAYVLQTLDSLKSIYPTNITVSAGDNFGGSFFYAATRQNSLLPQMFADMNISISALGNHEFDDGQEELALKWKNSEHRPHSWNLNYLSANVRLDDGTQPQYVLPWAMEEATLPSGKKINVAFIGLSTSNTPWQASARRVKGLHFDGRYNAVLDSVAQLPQFKAAPPAAMTVLLTHIGTDMKNKQVVWDDRDEQQLRNLNRTDIQAVLSAHSHVAVCGMSDSKRPLPIVQGYWHGIYISMLECRVDTLRNVVTAITPRLIRVNPHAKLSPKAARLEAQIQEQYATTLFRGLPLNHVLTHAESDIPLNRKKNREQTRIGQLVCSSYAEAARPLVDKKEQDFVVGVSHFGSIRAGFSKGDITVLDVGETLPFANKLHAFRFSGKELKHLMDFGMNECTLGCIQTSGIVADRNKDGKIKRLQLRLPSGKLVKIKDDSRLIVVADDYMTTGGDGYPVSLFSEENRLPLTLPQSTDSFIAYLKTQKAI